MQGQGLYQSQELRQEQILAPQQIQSLEILMAPLMELEERIAQEMEANPVLELERQEPDGENHESDADDSHEAEELQIQSAAEHSGPEQLELGIPPPEESSGRDADADEELNRILELAESWQGAIPHISSGESQSDEEERRQRIFDSIVEEPSLQEQLLEQLRLSERTPSLERMAELIIGSIDDSGYLRTHLADIATAAGASLEKAEEALAFVQTFDPPGIGARDIRECLLLQLERQGKGKSHLAKLVRNHLEDISKNRLPTVAKKLGMDIEQLNGLIEELRTLNPYPGSAMAPDSPVYVIPEVYVESHGDDFSIVPNEEHIPRLRISNLYMKLLEDPNTPEDTKSYIRSKLSSGKMIIKSLEQRQSTIRRIADVIVSTQHEFLANGVEHLKPLTMQQVADKLGLHETTISRAIANKYVQTPIGLFEFKYFFTGGYQSEAGEEISSRSVKEMIRDLISREDESEPLSDSKIADTLKERGLDVARRTVAKYREELGIQSSHLRKAY